MVEADGGCAAELISLLEPRLDHAEPSARAYLPSLIGEDRGVLAVIFYGSRLLGRSAAADSEPDFYLVVESLRRYHQRLGQALLGAVLPPSVFHGRLRLAGGDESCKVCVISASQLERETSPVAADLHHLGRFSKRIGLIYSRDAAARRSILQAQARSLAVLAAPALSLLDERFALDDFARGLLGLSYRAEPRVPEPHKIEALFLSDRDHYRALARVLLRAQPGVLVDGENGAAGDTCYQLPPASTTRAATVALIRASRRRELLRWPKYLLTFDGWLDYALRKLERHTGRRVVLSERARRHPLLYAWPTFYALRREGLVK